MAAIIGTRRNIDPVPLTEHLRKRQPSAAAWAFLQVFFLPVFSRLTWRRAFWRLPRWLPVFSLPLSSLSPSALSFLFRGLHVPRYRACGQSTRGHRSGFPERRRRR